jgi:hypothetical protein
MPAEGLELEIWRLSDKLAQTPSLTCKKSSMSAERFADTVRTQNFGAAWLKKQNAPNVLS